ncbi:hypothetical protein A9299_08820 [Moraxella osloensis]|uniref:Uncharacterized protein n=1 Tax=Faucicola osloensis TaxID=34062 RepID=A0AA91FR52_FAUOS|nr:hypothetical protein A9299_08820 [Moraxella osloensis]
MLSKYRLVSKYKTVSKYRKNFILSAYYTGFLRLIVKHFKLIHWQKLDRFWRMPIGYMLSKWEVWLVVMAATLQKCHQ